MSSKGGLTPSQAQFFATILKNMKGKPNVDWETVAIQAGYSGAKTAQTRYGQIMKQLALDAGDLPKSSGNSKQQRQESEESGSKVGSGMNLGAMKVTKPNGRAGAKAKSQKAQKVMRIWKEDSVGDDDEGDVEA